MVTLDIYDDGKNSLNSKSKCENVGFFAILFSIVMLLSVITGIILLIYVRTMNKFEFKIAEKGLCEITDNNGIFEVKNGCKGGYKNRRLIDCFAVEYKVVYNNKYENVSIFSDNEINKYDLNVDEHKVGDKLPCFVEISTGTPTNGKFTYTSPSLIMWLGLLFLILIPCVFCVGISSLLYVYRDDTTK